MRAMSFTYHGGEVEDGITAVERAHHLREARDIDGLPLHIRAVRLGAIEYADGMARFDELVDDVAANET
jgi:hypothetical protein